MSYEKLQFDEVYAEAFVSGVGVGFETLSSQYEAYVSNFLKKPRRPAWVPFTSKYEATVLKHPYAEAWLEEDLIEQARIAFFGRCLIETAKTSLQHNEEWLKNSEKDSLVSRVGNFMQFARWVEAHPNELDPDRSYDPDVASPLRLVDWPNGKYVNCLGQSIALAAAAELTGVDYLYANELITTSAVLTQQHRTIVGELEKVSPRFFEKDSKIQTIYEFIDIIRGSEEYRRSVLRDFDTSTRTAEQLRDFHHFVLEKDQIEVEDEAGLVEIYTEYSQVDPYALTLGTAYVDTDDFIADVLEAPENIVVIDNHEAMLAAYRSLHVAIKRAKSLVKRNNEFGAGVQPSDLMAGVEDVCRELLDNEVTLPLDDLLTVDRYIANMRYLLLDAFDAIRIEAAVDKDTAEKFLNLRYGVSERTADEYMMFREFDKRVHEQIQMNEKMDIDLAREIRRIGNELPLILVMQVYADLLRFVWDVKNWGSACAALEIADPELMIGAMYLNHYASHRKDGRINVARYLVRYTVSQLIWQAAQLDGESAEDPSLEAVGQIVKSLPARQLHPRVALNLRSATTNPLH